MSDTIEKKALTPEGVVSYPHLAAPQKAQKAGETEKYSITLVFTPELLKKPENAAALAKLEQIELNAANEKFPGKGADLLRTGKLRSAIRRDAEKKDYPAGSVFVNLRTKDKPGVVSRMPIPGTTRPAPIAPEQVKERVYPGSIARASVSAFYYDNSGNKGISFGLNNVQLMDETTPRIAGRRDASDEFDADMTQKPASLDDLA